MLALFLASSIFLAEGSYARGPKHTAEAKAAAPRPWYVKAVSDQVVDFCCLGGMLGGMAGMGGYHTVAAPTTVSFSSYFTETFESDTATTLYTTIPGGVVTIYGSAGDYTTTSNDQTYTTVLTLDPSATGVIGALNGTFTLSTDDAATTTSDGIFQPTYTPSTTAPHGFIAELERVESYAHALAEAILAPVQMTKLISSAYDVIMEHGFIHATQAVEFVSEASRAYDALRTDPAYAEQSKKLLSEPTPVNFKKAIAAATQSHSKGIARLVAEPSGKKVYQDAKELGEKFVKEFVHPH